MKMSFGELTFDSNDGVSIAIALEFNGAQANAWDVSRATAIATEAGDLVGDTRRGGSCNFETYTLIPHCNGTHTECVGHITLERISVSDCLKESLMSAALVTVEPQCAGAVDESLTDMAVPTDLIVTAASVRNSLSLSTSDIPSAIVIRTIPNDDSKKTRLYNDDSAPYFSIDCIELLNELGIRHLVCDLPSIDRMNDGGILINHKSFWGIETNSDRPDEKSMGKTITELAYIPDSLEDGIYVLDLQIPDFMADAAPSRPILYRTNQK